jgi:mono/diheme cytochrome c family protein
MTRVQLEIFLGMLLILITGAILIFVGINEERRMGEFELHQQAQAIELGAELFEINCRGCHGLQGEGIAGLAPPLNDAYFFTNRIAEVGWQGGLEDYIIATVSTGRQVSTRPQLYPGSGSPAMPTWADRFGGPLREDQIEALAAFITNWEATALGDVELAEIQTAAELAVESDDPLERGLAVYNTSGCGGCHAIEGISVGVVGPALSQIATVAATRVDGYSAEEYLRESIANPSAYLVESYDDLMLKTFADSISDSQFEDLIAFLLAQE